MGGSVVSPVVRESRARLRAWPAPRVKLKCTHHTEVDWTRAGFSAGSERLGLGSRRKKKERLGDSYRQGFSWLPKFLQEAIGCPLYLYCCFSRIYILRYLFLRVFSHTMELYIAYLTLCAPVCPQHH